MSKYQKRKEQIRQEAIDWQNNFEKNKYFYSDLVFHQDYFTRLAKRYGLVKEFRENAII